MSVPSPAAAAPPRSAGQPTPAGSAPGTHAADLLRQVDRIVADEFAGDDRLARTARHLIRCAAEVVAVLPDGDLEAAREALGCARAAVGAATYAVRVLNDNARTG